MKMNEVGIDYQGFVNYLNGQSRGRWVLITPDLAKEYLKQNTNNYRTLKYDTVEGYRKDIEAGEWEINGETITIDENGVLLDGQHRLTAIVKANKPVIIYVIYHIPTTNLYDRGKNRTQVEILQAKGYVNINTTILASASIFLTNFSTGGSATRIGNSAVEKVLDGNLELFSKAYRLSMKGKQNPPLRNASTIAAIFSILKNNLISEEKIETVMKIANTGFPEEGFESSPGIALGITVNESKNISPASTRRMCIYDSTYQALVDFDKQITRKKKYMLTTKSADLFKKTRIQLGL